MSNEEKIWSIIELRRDLRAAMHEELFTETERMLFPTVLSLIKPISFKHIGFNKYRNARIRCVVSIIEQLPEELRVISTTPQTQDVLQNIIEYIEYTLKAGSEYIL